MNEDDKRLAAFVAGACIVGALVVWAVAEIARRLA